MRVLLILLALTAAGCIGSSDESGSSQTSTPRTTAPPATHAVEHASEYAVPPTIDEEYVEKVMRALDHQYGEAARAFKKDGVVDDDMMEHLAAVYDMQQLEFVLEFWRSNSAELAAGLADVPGDPVTTVREIRSANRTCVLVLVDRDYRPIDKPGLNGSPGPAVVHLTTKPTPPSALNPTPWIIAGYSSSDTEVADPC